jgi:hypothetical protein
LYDAFGEPLDRHPVPVDDVPLSRLEAPADIMRVTPMGDASSAAPRAAGSTGLMGRQQAGQVQPVGSGVRTQAVVPSNHVSDEVGFAPVPVRKKAIWNPQK